MLATISGELQASQLDGLVERREAPDVVAAGVDADDHGAAPAQQLDEPEVVPVPAVGDEHEAVAVVVPAEDLLEQVAVPRLGELRRGSEVRRGFGSQMPRSMFSAAISAFVVPRDRRPIAEAKAAPDVAIHAATARSRRMSSGIRAGSSRST